MVKLSTKFEQKSNNMPRSYCKFKLSHSTYPFVTCNNFFMLWRWPLTRWPSTFVVHQVSCDQSLYESERNWTIPGWLTDNLPTRFEQNGTISSWVIDDFSNLFQGGRLPNSTPQRGDQTAPNLGRTELHDHFTKQDTLVLMRCFVSEWQWLKDKRFQRSRPHFTLFDPL